MSYGPIAVRVAPNFMEELSSYVAAQGWSAAPNAADEISIEIASVIDEADVRDQLEQRLREFGEAHPDARLEMLGVL